MKYDDDESNRTENVYMKCCLLYTSAGLFEQIAPANVRYYTKLTTELFEDYLFDLCYNIIGTNAVSYTHLVNYLKAYEQQQQEYMAQQQEAKRQEQEQQAAQFMNDLTSVSYTHLDVYKRQA